MFLVYKLAEWIAGIVVYTADKVTGGREQLLQMLAKVRDGLRQESVETRDMVRIYNKFLVGQATREELRYANQQFVDVLKALGIGIVVVLPFAPLTLPVLAKIAEKLGFSLLPSAFADAPDKLPQQPNPKTPPDPQ